MTMIRIDAARYWRVFRPAVALLAIVAGAVVLSARALELGTHVHDLGAGAEWPPPAFAHVRLWDARVAWPDLEPLPNQWRFGRLDRIVADGVGQGRQILLPLGLSPHWASSRPAEASAYGPGNAAPPAHDDDWQRYIITLAQRYKGRIPAYQIWNEPNKARFFSGDVGDMVRLTCGARKTLKAIDPSATLVSPAATGQRAGVRWLDRFLAAGGAACIDVIAFHFYTLAHEPPEAISPLVDAVREVMARHRVEHLPLWDTEFGWFIANARYPVDTTYRVLQGSVASAFLARAWLLRASLGLQRAYFYAWNNRNMGLVEPDSRDPKPAAAILPRVQTWLTSPWQLGRCSQESALWRCPLLIENRQCGYVAWASDSAAEGRFHQMIAEARAKGATVEPADGTTGAISPGMPVRVVWNSRQLP